MAKGDDLFLVGGGQLGCLYAVYDFLEDNLGFRHYFWRDDGFVVDKVNAKVKVKGECGGEVEVEGIVWNGKPTRKRPKFSGYRVDHHVRKPDALFELRNRGNGLVVEWIVPGYRSALSGRIAGHGFNPFLLPPEDPPADYGEWTKTLGIKGEFKSHPEWFTLDKSGKRVANAQLCLSNPGCREKLFENLLKWVKACGAGNYMVGSNDNQNDRYCWCEGCRALEKKYDSVGGPLWDWILWACPKLEAMGYTNVYITSLAYKGPKQTERAPSGIAHFPKNFICDAAFLNSDRPLADVPDLILEDGSVYNRLANLRRWCAICDHVSYWYYGGNNPAQVYSRTQAEMKELYEAGVKSVGACGGGGGWDFSDFTSWIVFRLLQDPYADLEPDLKRIFAAKYGPAAPLVRAYVDALERCRRTAAKTLVETSGTDSMYGGFGYLTGEDLLGFRKLMDEALAVAKGTPYENHVKFARFGLNVWTVTMYRKIKATDPAAAAKIDLQALDAETRAAAEAYMDENMSGAHAFRRRSAKYHSPVYQMDEMANYANLKTDALPPELAKYPADKVERILPAKQRTIPGWLKRPERTTTLADPDAVSGFAWYDYFDGAKLTPPVELGYLKVECYDEGTKTWLFPNGCANVALSRLVPGKYTLVRLGRQRVPSNYWLVFGGLWGSQSTGFGYSNIHSPARLYDPSYQNREWEVWASIKAEGPKFFRDAPKEAKSLLSIDQMFYVDMGVPEGK